MFSARGPSLRYFLLSQRTIVTTCLHHGVMAGIIPGQACARLPDTCPQYPPGSIVKTRPRVMVSDEVLRSVK